MEGCGCLFVAIFLIIAILFIFPVFGLIVLLLLFIFGYFIDKEKRLSYLISFFVGASIFFVLFTIFTATSLLIGGESNLFLGDTRYVNINDKYTLHQIDSGEFTIEGSLSLYGIDSLAETNNYVYGHLKNDYINGKTRDTYFTLSLKDGDIKKDTIFEYLELPAQCTRATMMSAENYLYKKSQEQLRDWKEVVFWPFIFALSLAFIISFFTKKLVKWLETKYKNWRAKKEKENEVKIVENKDDIDDDLNDRGPDPIQIGD